MSRSTMVTTMRKTTTVLVALGSMLFAASAFAADSTGEPGRSGGKKNPLNNVYLGPSAGPCDSAAFGSTGKVNNECRF